MLQRPRALVFFKLNLKKKLVIVFFLLKSCPQGYSCDEKEGRCNKGDVSIPFLSKIKAISTENKINAKTVCPGGEAECPSGSTCCQLESGDWGCW